MLHQSYSGRTVYILIQIKSGSSISRCECAAPRWEQLELVVGEVECAAQVTSKALRITDQDLLSIRVFGRDDRLLMLLSLAHLSH